jgi:hypothetical protein
MMDHRITRAVIVRTALILMGCAPCFCLQAAESDYVAAVRADVEEFTTHEFEAPAESTWLGSADEVLAGGDLGTLEGFSQFLRSKSPGSHIFYRKLPKPYQEQLRTDYLATGDLDRIKEDIFKYTREVKNK